MNVFENEKLHLQGAQAEPEIEVTKEETDMYLPDKNLCIEYGSQFYHESR